MNKKFPLLKRFIPILVVIIILTIIGLQWTSLWGVISHPFAQTNSIQPTRSSQIEPSVAYLTPTTLKPIDNSTNIAPTTTQNPLATYSGQEAELILLNNGKCKFPCVWGNIPGSTTVEDIKTFVSKFGKYNDEDYEVDHVLYQDMGGISVIFRQENLRATIDYSYYNNSENVELITLSLDASEEKGGEQRIIAVFGNPYFNSIYSYYQLSSMLAIYGLPRQILIAPFPDDENPPMDYRVPFSLILDYSDQAFLLQYIFPKEYNQNKYIGCPTKTGYIDVVTWESNNAHDLSDIVGSIGGIGINPINYSYFKPLAEVTNFSIDDFYSIFVNPDSDACIETDKALW